MKPTNKQLQNEEQEEWRTGAKHVSRLMRWSVICGARQKGRTPVRNDRMARTAARLLMRFLSPLSTRLLMPLCDQQTRMVGIR